MILDNFLDSEAESNVKFSNKLSQIYSSVSTIHFLDKYDQIIKTKSNIKGQVNPKCENRIVQDFSIMIFSRS